jgi:hypothetical protein
VPDSYLTISEIATNAAMHQRLSACTTQQKALGTVPAIDDALFWVNSNAYLWASSPTWAEKWDYALATHPPVEGEDYDPGRDATVITDDDVRTTVQTLGAAPDG